MEKIRQKLKDFNIDLGDFGNEYLDQLKDKVKDYWKKLKDRLGVSKRNADVDVAAVIDEFEQLINEKFDPERKRHSIEKYVGETKLVEALTEFIRENGKESLNMIRDVLKKFMDKILGLHRTSNSNVFEEIRDFFKDLGIRIKNRFAKFGEWVKEEYKKSLEKSKNRLQNVKNIAKETHTDQPTQTGVRPTTVGGETTS
ncbi:hypothetical protein AVEN_114830-1 [Araneus ventricosus]|uniref:Laminin subunit alpha-2 n=1 Tax=Araneus ventricosus TaxID=182803 RepID=A0A4Y2TV39_ARAVE|nr:hypothetical protein AVEN_114830-1 [Araneus ventricosus]